ncbi:hypothetical protein BU23DRAFT_560101 [Bimuria novae-zelandiae CBS 107.79]|uniref:Ubiquitin 3 binding protein But2 C-terminal domain-containing protein n=1 Tax=Bimuria novae-zelandiae CBS 107.79 TaxID=1447943 RepID=A0A6A5UQ34_9PLEO|nr:hypothetical protein BU23DRAFT_560101 [Bimuria novae-zelandiae CBS 107.79]
MYTKSFIAVLAATAVSAAPVVNVVREDNLQPWQIMQLLTHTPSGRPGNNLHSTLNITIHDPNVIPAAQSPTDQAVFPATTATCSLQYLTSADVPWGVQQPCTMDDNTKAYSTWVFTINKPAEGTPDASTNFDLSFKLVDNVYEVAQNVTKTFVGGDHFEVGVNMGGQCGGSGVCNWHLNGTPYEIQQK